MSARRSVAPKWTLERFLAHALAIEEEAALRYRELALQLEVHHNEPVSHLFTDLAAEEARHAERIRRLVGTRRLPVLKPWEYRWKEPESPEAAPYDAAHYRMTAHHALRMALAAEQRAERFFAAVARQTSDRKLKALAKEFATEELSHAASVTAALEKTPAPPANWAADFDPPIAQD
ncbi:MAG TPA: ferritin family protein [Stellaceae bacterium]|nr:ferritin family protein [Stellaceae bacterium]